MKSKLSEKEQEIYSSVYFPSNESRLAFLDKMIEEEVSDGI